MYRDILVPVDLDEPETDNLIATAVDLARRSGCRLHVLTVVPPIASRVVAQYFPPDFEEKMLANARKDLEALVARMVPSDIPVNRIVAHGTKSQEIVRHAEALEADLIIMARHKPSFADILLGNEETEVIRHTSKSSMLVG